MYETIETGNKTSTERYYEGFLLQTLQSGAIPERELAANLHVFLRRQTLSRLLQLNELYQKILDLPGVIMQCGVRWGGDLVTLASLRTLYEPFNYSRRIVGFDTFEGLRGTGELDQGTEVIRDGQFNVTPGYEQTLEKLLSEAEAQAPIPHIKKHVLKVGDARETVPRYLAENAGEMIALLYLDMDIYQPTVEVLRACAERLVPGAVVVFDEYCLPEFPGEAVAARELSDILGLKLYRSRLATATAYGIKQ